MLKQIVVKTQFEALHCWKTIGENRASQFLKHPHRHLFIVRMWFDVSHNDRELEFFEIKAKLDAFIKKSIFWDGCVEGVMPNVGDFSCEDLAEKLFNCFRHLACTKVSVFEDDECGAVVSKPMPETATYKVTGTYQP